MQRRALVIAGLVVLFAAIALVTARLPTADFYVNFYRAARAVVAGGSPYEAPAYSSAPWGIIPLLPLAFLSPLAAHGVYFAACLFILAYVGWRLKAGALAMVALFLSPTAIATLLVGNLDSIIITGMLMPPALGLLFLLVKPQIGAGVALYYLIDSVRERRLLEAIKIFAPIVAAIVLALLLFPIWY